MKNVHIAKITIYQLRIPFRQPFAHGSAIRHHSDNVVVQLELGNDIIGFGETLAREYVTGETQAGVVESIQRVFLPILMTIRPEAFGQVLEALENLPFSEGAKPLYAARCAVELALLDAYGKQFGRDPTMLAGWIDQPYWEPPGATATVRYSGIIGMLRPEKAKWLVRLMRLWQLNDLKIKVGDDLEWDRLKTIVDYLSGPIAQEKVRLRVDANSAWPIDVLPRKVDQLEELGVLYLEQPTPREDDAHWLPIQHESGVNLIADESLISFTDAERLAEQYRVGVFNVRIAKNGGLLPALKLAAFAYNRGIEIQLGCMVGETGILTRAGQWFASIVPELLFAEGGYGALLLKDDIVKRRERFRYGGKIRVPAGPGLGVKVDPEKLRRYSLAAPIVINV